MCMYARECAPAPAGPSVASSQHHLLAQASQARDINADGPAPPGAGHRDRSGRGPRELDVRAAGRGVVLVVFEAVEVLVALAADVAAVGLFLFHAQGAGVGGRGFGVDDGEGAVGVFVQLLVVVAVLVGGRRVVRMGGLGGGCGRGGGGGRGRKGKRKGRGNGRGATYGFVVFEAVLVFVCLFAADDGTAEGFWFLPVQAGCGVRESGHHLLFSYSSC